ncbi:sugar ABC transporter permease [Streptomyces tubbatahanensis]|uniref:Sugar ABC transporter permease n=1 Tax=Streptomyces tubbatahanensis TaxID=2923272 RepID=A0ABY3XPW7_9ACTN|nr:sugar ABC transporter permease [Streptomyces tubbatahanensis]UNS96483.1 sugar ABC transporter permease [Streptomyces tubbatahanensis]
MSTASPASLGDETTGTVPTARGGGRGGRGTPPPRTPAARKRLLGLDHGAWFLLLPALLPILVLSVGPLLYAISLAFTDAQFGRTVETDFIGVTNFADLRLDSLFWESFRIGLVWAVAVTALQLVLALGLALLLNQNLRFRWLARTLALVPWAMPEVVVGIMWRLVYHQDAGILNKTLRQVGLLGGPAENIDWLTNLSLALPAVILVGVWAGMPQTTVVLLAGLQNVPHELTEAAQLDGAGVWRRFASVTWPALKPVAVAMTALNFIWNFNSFGLVYVLTQGGPGGQTRLPMLFAYEEAFKYGQFGYAAAMGVVMIAVVAVFLTVFLRKRLKEDAI